MQRWVDGRWVKELDRDSVSYIAGHWVAENVSSLNENRMIEIPTEHINGLVDFLHKNGYIRPQIVPESRTEDLKIIHRLFDLVDKNVVPKS